MGWLGLAGDGMGTHEQKSRAPRGLATIWRTGRFLSRQSRNPGVQPHVGRTVSELGVARPVLVEPRHDRDRLVDPARHPRDADFPAGDRG